MLTVIKIPTYEHLMCFRGSQEAFLAFNWDVLLQKFEERTEYILFSSTKHISGEIFAVVRPGRHHHCIRAMSSADVSGLFPFNAEDKMVIGKQGFLTNFGRWVSRKEAFLIATSAGQPLNKSDFEGSTTLFSECIWETPERYHWTPPVENINAVLSTLEKCLK